MTKTITNNIILNKVNCFEIIENIKEEAIREQNFTRDDLDEKEYESRIIQD